MCAKADSSEFGGAPCVSLRNGKVHKGAEVHKVMQSFFTDAKFTFRLSFVEFSRRLFKIYKLRL
jgi:hypothetical protein